jgi:hypothetical protein
MDIGKIIREVEIERQTEPDPFLEPLPDPFVPAEPVPEPSRRVEEPVR